MFKLYDLTENIIYLKTPFFKAFSLGLNNNEELMNFFLLFYIFVKNRLIIMRK
jgi:hypothetical protein